MRTYRDYCRPANPIERTEKRHGHLVLTGSGFVAYNDPKRDALGRFKKAGVA